MLGSGEVQMPKRDSLPVSGSTNTSISTHRQKLLDKANGSLEALRAMTGSVWGASLVAMRKVYQAVVVPQMLYGISAWYCPAARFMPTWEMKRTVNEFTNIQRRAAILISGAFNPLDSSGTSKSSQSPRRAKETIRQDDLATAQGVKMLGRGNAKTTANREVVEEYIQHQQQTPPIENEAGEIPGMEVQRKRLANVRAWRAFWY
ncbi:hypothetical protein PENSUB_6340 [Penicillium subrubescens]|uniref:Uncharacterized protein n=1 Tax=Penicillium subrubescens TaxID=1316194 RepID=A0A1Q5U1J1_9EURO|nr:hypothetical protein PENSUB_6340 [Penicillium subrubescens]